MTYTYEKLKAKELRVLGMSIRKISETLGLNKSTVSYWCRDVVLSKKQKDNLIKEQRKEGIKALLKNAEIKREKRIKETKKLKNIGEEKVGILSHRDLFIAGLAFYWGEGYKEANEEVGFTNSDPHAILFIMRWFQEVFCVEKKDFIIRITVNISHQNREEEILRYWSKILKIPRSQFNKITFIKTKKIKQYKNGKKYFGTARIKVRRGTQLKRIISGALDKLSNSYADLI